MKRPVHLVVVLVLAAVVGGSGVYTVVGIAAFSDVDREESLYDYQCYLSHYDVATRQWSALTMSI
jgi:hypothetical protein